MEQTHIIIDGIIKNLKPNIVFTGTHDECRKWIYNKSFDYQILRNPKAW